MRKTMELITDDDQHRIMVNEHRAAAQNMTNSSFNGRTGERFYEITLHENNNQPGPFWTGWGSSVSDAIVDAFKQKRDEDARQQP